jgi:hypothetical protein
MIDGDKPRNGFAADFLRRAVRREEFRVRGFQLLQLLDQPVVFEVRNLRLGLGVIEDVMPADFGESRFRL